MNLEPKVKSFLAALDAAHLPHFEDGTPEQARALVRAMRPAREPRPLFEITDHQVPAERQAVRVRLYRPTAEVPGCIHYLHGGGWVLGDIDGFDDFARELAWASGWAVALPEYRLAPEHPFPVGLNDAHATLRWLTTQAPRLFGDHAAVVVMGDSAGGNLAAVLALRARDEGAPRIAGQVLAYPVTDAGMNTESYRQFAQGPVLTAPLMAWFWSHYIHDEQQREHPSASPLRAGTLTGLPPTFLMTAENDPLRDEGEAYGAALVAAEVSVRSKRYDGQVHGFLTMVGASEGGAQALRDVGTFLRELASSAA